MAAKYVSDLTRLAPLGSQISIKVTPGTRRARVWMVDGAIRVAVKAVPEDGRATAAAQCLLAQALRLAGT